MKMKRSYWGKISILLTVALIVLSVVGITIFASAEETNTQNYTAEPVTSISNTEDLQKFVDSVNTGGLTYEGQTVVLQNDIAWEGTWESIEQFHGTFDGQGYTISGLTDAFITNLGSFDKHNATIENLNIRGEITISYPDEYVPEAFGGIADINYGIISGCTFGGIITKEKNIPGNSCGGIVAINYGRIENCSTISDLKIIDLNTDDISFNMGGIAGKCIINSKNIDNQPSVGIYNCINNSNIKLDLTNGVQEDIYLGGICGNLTVSAATIKQLKQLDPQIQNCINNGSLTSYAHIIGGICGCSDKGKITDCQNNGNISSHKNFIGGIVGLFNGADAYTENTDDNTDVIYIKKCINKGNITGDSYVGGIAGNSTQSYRKSLIVKPISTMTIEDCINSGDITTAGYGGGISGYNSSKIKRCYNTGNIYGHWINSYNGILGLYIGGIASENANEISYCFNIGEVKVDVDEPLQYSIYAGGLVGLQNTNNTYEYELSGKLVYSYNSGPVTVNYNSSTSETEYPVYYGGLLGEGYKESVENCTFNKDSAGNAVRAIGSYIGDDSNLGLDASKMTGEAAKENMPYLFQDGVFEIIEDVTIDGVHYSFTPILADMENPYSIDSDKMIANASYAYIKITLPQGEGYFVTAAEGYNPNDIELGGDFGFYITLDESHKNYDVTVTENGEIITPNSEGIYYLTNLQTSPNLKVSLKASEVVTNINKIQSPATGDIAIMSFLLLALICGIVAIAFVNRNRKTTL